MYVYEIQSDAMIPNFTNIGNTYIKWDVTPSVKSVRVDKLDDYIVGTRFSSPNNQNNLWIMAKDPENNELILSSIKPVSESEFKFDGLIGEPISSIKPSVKSVRVDKLDDYIVGTRFSSPNNQNNLWIMAKDPENNELILSSIKPVSESEFKFDGLIGGPKSSGGSKKSRTKPKKKISKTNPKKISKTKTKKSPKIHTGPRGGKYIVKKGKKIYQ